LDASRLGRLFFCSPHEFHRSRNTSKAASKYLTVTLDNESYGIAVLKVREIIRLQKNYADPQMPDS